MIGRYELLQRLGHGGMATVFLGRATGTAGFAKRVAIKVIHPHLATEVEFVDMFLDEAHLASELHHPNVVDTLDLGQDGNTYYTVLELIEGDSLAGLLTELDGEPLPIDVVLLILLDACAGLEAAHELRGPNGSRRDLVHRDVSPQNLLVNLDGWVKVTDFGIAKAVGRTTHTRPGQLRGKLQYMSPEQARGDTIDRRADLFALGLIGYEILSGKRPFTGDTAASALRRVLECEIPALNPEALQYKGSRLSPALSRKLCDIIERAIHTDVDARYSSAAEFASALREVLGQVDTAGQDPRHRLAKIMRAHFQGRVDYMHAQFREGSSRSSMRMSKDQLDRQGIVLTPIGEAGDSVIKPSSSSPSTRSTASWTADLDGKAQQSMRGKMARTIMPVLLGSATIAVALWMIFPADVPMSEVAPRERAAGEGPAAAAAAAAKETNVRWFISSDPDGASIRVDGVEWAEKTPTSVILPRSTTPVEVVIEKTGYVPARARLAPVADQSFPYQLRALTPPSQVLSMPRSTTGAREEAKRAGGPRKSSAKTPSEATQETTGSGESPLPPRQSRKFKPMPNFSGDSP
ncbi:MAG: serine/threonine protein kinase [Nannocystaceae bacterium]